MRYRSAWSGSSSDPAAAASAPAHVTTTTALVAEPDDELLDLRAQIQGLRTENASLKKRVAELLEAPLAPTAPSGAEPKRKIERLKSKSAPPMRSKITN